MLQNEQRDCSILLSREAKEEDPGEEQSNSTRLRVLRLVGSAKSLRVGETESWGNQLRRELAQGSCPAVSDRQIFNELG
jgi:hypothetical protein